MTSLASKYNVRSQSVDIAPPHTLVIIPSSFDVPILPKLTILPIRYDILQNIPGRALRTSIDQGLQAKFEEAF